MLKGGYMGQILRVNLTTKEVTKEETQLDFVKNYLGGAGFGIKLLFDEVPQGADPLGEENKLIFASGPFSGTATPCASRMAITTKSPLTGAVGMSLTGGHFPVELKFAGYDALIIEGKADKPVYLWIHDDKVSIRSAEGVWGTTTFDAQQIIKDELNDQNIRIACIGPAGENLSKISSIINERRAAGRKGVGAVMGSKNLKAVAVRGSQKVPVHSEKAFKEARSVMLKAMKDSEVLYPAFSKMGTPMVVDAMWGLGIFPTNNFSATGQWDPVDSIGAETSDTRKIGREHCYGCPVGCSQLKLAKSGPYAGTLSEPEYETMYSFGGETGVDNIDSIIYADRTCDELGMDTMSVGATIGFAMELYERGIISNKDTEGLTLNFGNHEVMNILIPRMAYREGFGGVLADGSRIAAERIGRGSAKYAMHVKGLELPGYDPRGAKAHGLSYATSYTGADHNRGYAFQEIFGIPVPYPVDRFASQGKGKLTKWNQDVRAATCDCPTMCAFLMDMAVPAIALENTANLLSAISGVTLTPEEIQNVGERLNNLARTFNIREGLTKSDDYLPERFLTEPLKDGTSKGSYIPKEEFEAMLSEYYEARDWSPEGIPSRAKLESLGLTDAINTLEKMDLL